ncbi:MAG: hypothetical protein R3C28_15300 [Pirellulaceae bacterium]
MNQEAMEVVQSEFKLPLSQLIECYAGSAPFICQADEAKHTVEDGDGVLVTTIGFGDESFRGSLLMLASKKTTISLSQSNVTSVTDWFGELANQLAGRLKNKLATYGVLPQLGLPVTLECSEISVRSQNDDTRLWQVEMKNGRLVVLLRLEAFDHLEWIRTDETVTAEEGSLCLF